MKIHSSCEIEISSKLIFASCECYSDRVYYGLCVLINPFRAPKPLPILNPSNFVPKNGFPVVKGLNVGRRLPLATTISLVIIYYILNFTRIWYNVTCIMQVYDGQLEQGSPHTFCFSEWMKLKLKDLLSWEHFERFFSRD